MLAVVLVLAATVTGVAVLAAVAASALVPIGGRSAVHDEPVAAAGQHREPQQDVAGRPAAEPSEEPRPSHDGASWEQPTSPEPDAWPRTTGPSGSSPPRASTEPDVGREPDAGPASDAEPEPDARPEPEDSTDEDADSGEEAAAPTPGDEAGDPDVAPEPEDVLGVVEEQQRRLRELGFLIGPADGKPGQQTRAAVMAFQQVNGLSVDGVVGPRTTEALMAGSDEPELAGGPADRIEVDLDAQLLHLIEDGERVVTLKVSSGSGETYRSSGGGTARARTPVGQFVVERRIHGVRNAPLGQLYDPLYFYRGYAIHGSPSVPAHPASHGCVRISMADAAWLIQRVPDRMPVHLYGGTHIFTV